MGVAEPAAYSSGYAGDTSDSISSLKLNLLVSAALLQHLIILIFVMVMFLMLELSVK